MNAVTFPMALLATGYYTPTRCVRHGRPAAELWPLHGGVIRNWPYCRQCVTGRRIQRAAAVACAVLPFVVMFVGLVLTDGDPALANVLGGLVVAGPLMSWFLVTRTSPSGLARAKVTDSQMWLVVQGPHPDFVAHAAEILRAAEREQPVLPTQQPVFPTAEGEINMDL